MVHSILKVNTRGLSTLELTIKDVQRAALSSADFQLTQSTTARQLVETAARTTYSAHSPTIL